jgi:hypothetical protein
MEKAKAKAQMLILKKLSDNYMSDNDEPCRGFRIISAREFACSDCLLYDHCGITEIDRRQRNKLAYDLYKKLSNPQIQFDF